MNVERYESLENFCDQISAQVLECPSEVIIDALQSISVDFFKKTEIWLEHNIVCLPAKTFRFEIALPPNSELVRVMSISIYERNMDKHDYHIEESDIVFHHPFYTETEAYIKTILRPMRYNVLVPSRYLEEYGDIIVQGALAKLKMMNGTGVEWRDPEMAKTYLELYNNGREQTRVSVLRERIGNTIKPTRSWP